MCQFMPTQRSESDAMFTSLICTSVSFRLRQEKEISSMLGHSMTSLRILVSPGIVLLLLVGTLSHLASRICAKKTNHCLRATGASELFDAGVPENIIKERTGHRSVEALRIYEHTTKKQLMAVSKILTICQKTTFESALKKEELTYNTSPFHPASDSTVNKFSNCTVHIYQAPMGQAQKPSEATVISQT